MRDKKQDKIFWAIVATETSHVFCCVLPTLFSIASLLTGLGIIVTMPGWLDSLHETMHDYELPAILLSAAVVLLGWGLHYYSVKNDCHDHGCEHEPCGPKKRRASKILIAASVLLAVNMVVYFGLHRPMEVVHTQETHDDHHGHDHHGHHH